jgi:transcriptional regulator with XRE-family HTH domain
MPAGARNAISPWSKQLIKELAEPAFRHAYLEDQVRTNIAFQIRALREQPGRQWTQAVLAEKLGTGQGAISRLENPDYGKVTLQTLLEVAAVCDVALLVQFVEWEDWLTRMADVSPSALRKRSFDANRLERATLPDPASYVTGPMSAGSGNRSRAMEILNAPPPHPSSVHIHPSSVHIDAPPWQSQHTVKIPQPQFAGVPM